MTKTTPKVTILLESGDDLYHEYEKYKEKAACYGNKAAVYLNMLKELLDIMDIEHAELSFLNDTNYFPKENNLTDRVDSILVTAWEKMSKAKEIVKNRGTTQ